MSLPPQPKGWSSRGYLPHVDAPGLVQAVTFRLSDSLPRDVVERLTAEGQELPVEGRDRERIRRLDALLDSGSGDCQLARPEIAELVETALLHFDGVRYRLLAWCVMPNHVHVLVATDPSHLLSDLVHTRKSFTGHRANHLLGRTGPFWMREYHDRFIRNAEHFARCRRYIERNPVEAGLVDDETAWRWSSAWRRRTTDSG